MGKPRILLADDHTLVVEAFKKLLESEFDIVGTVADGHALLEVAPVLKPDVVILDLGMPLLNGMDAGQELKRRLPQTKIIVLTMSEDYDLATQALIREALKGLSYVTPRIAKHLLQEWIRDPHPDRVKHLTPRQREVLQLVAEGRSMKEISTMLRIATRTVAFHKYRVMEEFGIKTNLDLVKFAIREGIVIDDAALGQRRRNTG
jgi:DNA-binding NarL/FixJ family response regulator